jgi:hypothetical protein
LQHLGAFGFEHPRRHLHLVVQRGVVQDLRHGTNRAGFGISGAIDQAGQTRVYQGSGTHRAWFNCNKQLTAVQAVVADLLSRCAQDDDLRVRSGIVVTEIAIAGASDDLTIADDDRTDGHFAARFRGAGFLERRTHELLVVEMRDGIHTLRSAPEVRLRRFLAVVAGAS